MDRFYLHKGRHIVRATSEQTQDGRVEVEWVCLNPEIAGKSRRGARPKYANAVSMDELTEVDPEVAAQYATPAATDESN